MSGVRRGQRQTAPKPAGGCASAFPEGAGYRPLSATAFSDPLAPAHLPATGASDLLIPLAADQDKETMMSFVFPRRSALGALSALAHIPSARAQEASLGPLRISAAWTRAAGAGATGVGYLTVRNTGTSPDRIVAARTPAARAVELHTHIREGEVMRMRPVPSIDLPPGQEVRLHPGGLHLMLIGLTAGLRQGERVAVTLAFERAGEVEVQFAVEAAGARGPAAAGHRH